MASSYYYSNSYPAYSSSDVASVALFGGALLLIWIIVLLAVYVVNSIFMMLIFKKAGVDGWKAWIPVYNSVKFFQLGGQNPLYILFYLIPFAGPILVIVFQIIAAHNIGLKLGKSSGYTVLYVFLPIVWQIILGVDKSTWKDSLGATSLAPEKSPK
jgi:hypothetical protein